MVDAVNSIPEDCRMPYYAGLKKLDKPVRERAVDGILALRKDLDAQVPARTPANKLLLATWNIREFDSDKYGVRTEPSLYYIAEIIDHFDMVAIQEVRSDLTALNRVRAILGHWWDVLYTDVTYGAPGNDERMAILYDTRKVSFIGLAGEVVLPESTTKEKKAVIPRQLARSPFICGFRCGWISFDLCSVHTYYGSATANEPRRIQEIADLAALLASRPDSPGSTQNVVLLGDFNIFTRTDKTFQALVDNGFSVPSQLMALPGTNVKQDKEYDQIAFLKRTDRFVISTAGVFNFYNAVFQDGAKDQWTAEMGEKYAASKNPDRYYKDWRTYQMSDHYPLWVELVINHSESYLQHVRSM
jgi:endonuclease/exonuclease/phosphatase family metal-dependent hydrolase